MTVSSGSTVLSAVGSTVTAAVVLPAGIVTVPLVPSNVAAPVSASYDVGYVFTGFFSPVAVTGKTFKAGSSIPLKWRLQDAQQSYITRFSAILGVQVAPDPSCTAGGEGVAFDAGSPGNSGLQLEQNTFQFNWQTTGLATGCYAVMVVLDDGTRKTTFLTLR